MPVSSRACTLFSWRPFALALQAFVPSLPPSRSRQYLSRIPPLPSPPLPAHCLPHRSPPRPDRRRLSRSTKRLQFADPRALAPSSPETGTGPSGRRRSTSTTSSRSSATRGRSTTATTRATRVRTTRCVRAALPPPRAGSHIRVSPAARAGPLAPRPRTPAPGSGTGTTTTSECPVPVPFPPTRPVADTRRARQQMLTYARAAAGSRTPRSARASARRRTCASTSSGTSTTSRTLRPRTS